MTGFLSDLAERLDPRDPAGALCSVRESVRGRIVFTTSFGLEDQVVTHLILTQKLAIDIVTLDTGRLFPETHAVWAETELRYGVRITAVYPDTGDVEALVRRHGIDGFRESVAARKACCEVRKVAPLARVLAGAAVWVTGLRADQSAERGGVSILAADAERGLLKLSPLASWSREAVEAFAKAQDLPVNALHARGFLSIGCAPCTRAVRPGEPERAGRWWWEAEAAKECGLHVGADGRLVRAASPESRP